MQIFTQESGSPLVMHSKGAQTLLVFCPQKRVVGMQGKALEVVSQPTQA